MTEARNEIIAAIAKATGEARKVGKDGKNTHDNYNFASIDAFLALTGPVCAANGLVVQVDETGIEDFIRKGKYGDNAWMRVRYELMVYHASGQFLPPVARTVEVLRNGSQAYGSAQSYVLKQFLRALLQIPTGDQDDADHNATDAGLVTRSRVIQRNGPSAVHGNIPVSVHGGETPHDPETGEVRDERNPPSIETEEDADPPSVAAFIDQVRETLAMGGNTKPTREQLEQGYALAVIENIGKRKASPRAKTWFEIFCDLHGNAIGRIQDEGLRKQVRSAIALKQAQIAGEKPDPADFGFPFGHEPIVLGEQPVI